MARMGRDQENKRYPNVTCFNCILVIGCHQQSLAVVLRLGIHASGNLGRLLLLGLLLFDRLKLLGH